jgi:hypothetical protein
MRLTALLVVAGLFWPVSVLSQQSIPRSAFRSGNELYEQCVAQERSTQAGYCMGYVAGLADAFVWDGTLCALRGGVTEGQVDDVVVNYLRAHPEEHHYSAASIAQRALILAFPCNSDGP